ncbi:DUF4917 family protein [Rurimicrobium arvi]|uniref:DUF4917 family protein n=1 Tax=Rurimicrobium arvi TaxID=2049916 RepID=A0ABP8N0P6_9BACT
MDINSLPTYEQIIETLNKKNRVKHLLFGNGFSMSYDPTIFSYNSLSSFIQNIDDELLKLLFERLKTKNFETIMQQLDSFAEIAEVFQVDAYIIEKIKATNEKLKTSLIDAVRSLHPGHVFSIPEHKSKACHRFLKEYLAKNGFVFSTNYDLLPYWVLMRNSATEDAADVHPNDGFGRELLSDPDDFNSEREYSNDLIWGVNKAGQNVFYLHGALPIFDTGVDIIKEVYNSEHLLMENINERMNRGEYPIFITAGNGNEKLTNIMHNKYLSHCYETLSSIGGSLVTFGFNFGDYDTHVIEAINAAAKQSKDKRLYSVYIGVYSDADIAQIEKIKSKFRVKKIHLYNARTANIWQ